jgi:spore coat protein H
MMHRTGVALLAFIIPGWPTLMAQESTGDIFASSKIRQFHLTIPAKEYDAMQPIGGPRPGFFGGPFGAPMPPAKTADDRETHKNAFGLDLPLAHGSLLADGDLFLKIGVRYKGNGTIMDAAGTIKKSFKIDLARYNDKLRFHDLKSINLNSGVADPSKARDTLAYAAYRRAGVPAPRTALAEVTLTVPGKFDAEYLGLYTILEGVDKPFLKKHFKAEAGLVMKPERTGGLSHLGDNWEPYKTTYQPKRDATPEEAKRVIAFTRLVNLGSDEQFQKEIESYIDVDEFLRFMAVTAMVVNLDSFFVLGHNYILYLHPTTNKFHFIPWDMDRSFANFPLFGSPEQQMDLSITKPYVQSRLPDRLLAIKEYRDRQQRILKDVAATFTKEQLLKDLDAFETATKEIIAKGAKAAANRKEGGPGGFGPPGGPPGMGPGGPLGRAPDLRAFAEARAKSIEAQLAGKSNGYALTMGFGGPGGFGGPPGGMGPANVFGKLLFDAVDGGKTGKVSEAEFADGMKKLFREWDKDKSGSLDQREITEGLQRLMPNPQMAPFPGPGFPGGPPGKGPAPFPPPKGP